MVFKDTTAFHLRSLTWVNSRAGRATEFARPPAALVAMSNDQKEKGSGRCNWGTTADPSVRFGSKADVCSALGDVRYGPIADIVKA